MIKIGIDIRDLKTVKTEPDDSYEVIIKVEDRPCADVKPESTRARKVPSKKKTAQADVKKLDQKNKTKLSSRRRIQLELEKYRYNIQKLLQCSNATPIRKHFVGSGYVCCFCNKHFLKASDLKSHTLLDHDDNMKNKFMQTTRSLRDFMVKLDITSLRCKVCCFAFDTLEQLIDHLNNIHQKGLHTEIKSRIACFKLDGEALKCHICLKEFNSFRFLQTHMNKYFSNYICDVCGAGFITKQQLALHSDVHQMGSHKCGECGKVFSSPYKLKSHKHVTHIAALEKYKCFHCGEKFKNRNFKKNHMIEFHGVKFADLKCGACDKTFKNYKGLQDHRNRDHLMIRYTCKLCDSVFDRPDKLKRHEQTHTGVREFKCEQCGKSYSRKRTLIEHLRSSAHDSRNPLTTF